VSFAAVIPWRDNGDQWRRRWFAQAVDHWARSGLEVVTGQGGYGEAINDGVRRARAETVLVVDADVALPHGRALEALRLAAEAPGLVVAHDRVVWLTREASRQLTVPWALTLLDAEDRWTGGEATVEQRIPFGVGTAVAFSRATWEQAGRQDPSAGHGHDAAFALACGVLSGEQRRLPGDVLHLWHERPARAVEDPPEVWARLRAYHRAAEEGPAAMRRLVASR
jgi:hypothetical protein